jgi:hypothetical protein
VAANAAPSPSAIPMRSCLSVFQREHGCVDADAHSDGHHDRRREPLMGGDGAQRKSNTVRHINREDDVRRRVVPRNGRFYGYQGENRRDLRGKESSGSVPRAAGRLHFCDRHGTLRYALDEQMAEAIVQLRAIYLSGDFDRYWQFHIDQDQRRLYPVADCLDHFEIRAANRNLPAIRSLSKSSRSSLRSADSRSWSIHEVGRRHGRSVPAVIEVRQPLAAHSSNTPRTGCDLPGTDSRAEGDP